MRRVVSTMAPTKREKAFCILEFAKSGSVITVQRRFRIRYGKDPPGPNSIKQWHTKFEAEGCLCKGKSPGRPSVSGADPAGVSTQSKEVDAQSKCGAAAAPTDRLECYA
jgi:hypothetical protein